MMKQTYFYKQEAFTLIELTVVMFIMGILAVVSLANFHNAQRQRAVATSADTVTNAVLNAQNFALSSRQLTASSCSQGKAPKSYLIYFSSAQAMQLYGIDHCDVANLIESYTYQAATRVRSSAGYVLNSSSVSALQFKFEPPFGKLTASTSNTVNGGTFSSFTSGTITVESTDSQVSRTITVDGLSGRIGQ